MLAPHRPISHKVTEEKLFFLKTQIDTIQQFVDAYLKKIFIKAQPASQLDGERKQNESQNKSIIGIRVEIQHLLHPVFFFSG